MNWVCLEAQTGRMHGYLIWLLAFLLQYGIPLEVVSYKTLYNWTMDEIVKEIGLKNNCTFCGVFRRQVEIEPSLVKDVCLQMIMGIGSLLLCPKIFKEDEIILLFAVVCCSLLQLEIVIQLTYCKFVGLG